MEPINTNTWVAVRAIEKYVETTVDYIWQDVMAEHPDEDIIDYDEVRSRWGDILNSGEAQVLNLLWGHASFGDRETQYSIGRNGQYSANTLPIQDIISWLHDHQDSNIGCVLDAYKDNHKLYDSLSESDEAKADFLIKIKKELYVHGALSQLWMPIEYLLYHRASLIPKEGKPFLEINFAYNHEDILSCVRDKKEEYIDAFMKNQIDWNDNVLKWEKNREYMMKKLLHLEEQTESIWVDSVTFSTRDTDGIMYKPIETLLALEIEGAVRISGVYAPKGNHARMNVYLIGANSSNWLDTGKNKGRPLEAKFESDHIICGEKSLEIPDRFKKLRPTIAAMMKLTANKSKNDWIVEWQDLCEIVEGNMNTLDGTGKDHAKERMRNCIRGVNRFLKKAEWREMYRWSDNRIKRLY